MRVRNLAQAAAVLDGSALVADEELCLNLRGRTFSCEACNDSCPFGALQLSPDHIEIDEAACTRCGTCIPVCPAGAIRLTGFVPQRFLRALDGQEQVHLHCSASTDGGGGVVIPCHRVLDARLLASAWADGTRIFVLHGLERCADCHKGGAREHVRDVGAVLKEWFEDAAPDLNIAQPGQPRTGGGDRRHEDQVHLSRRGFLRLASTRAVSSAAGWLLPAAEEDDEAEELPFYQGGGEMKRPVAYQVALAARVTRLPWRKDRPLPWQRRTLADECSACLVCAQHCPTGALETVEDEKARSISFHTALCTDCGLCVQLCPEHAVRPQPVFSAGELTGPPVLLMHRTMSRCRNCAHPFLPATPRAELCQICQNEQELDDEWLAILEG
jgi:ferredoxin